MRREEYVRSMKNVHYTEFAKSCRVCEGEYFTHEAPGDRCMDCSWCWMCGDPFPDGEGQKYDSMCSLACDSRYESFYFLPKPSLAAKGAPYVPSLLAGGPDRAGRVSRSRKAKDAVLERDGWMCHLCLLPIDKNILWPAQGSGVLDHVVPLADGGADTCENLRSAHALCNSGKRDLSVDEYLAKVDLGTRDSMRTVLAHLIPVDDLASLPSLEARIRELEAAVFEVDPAHEVLNRAGVSIPTDPGFVANI